MKKTRLKALCLLTASFLLASCSSGAGDKEENEDANQVTVQTTANQLSSDYYRALIVDNKYKLSASASGDDNISGAKNEKAFEDGLLRISAQVFPTDQYFIQEGQLIDNVSLEKWLGRESQDNPEGLNPELPESATKQEEAESQAEEESIEEQINPDESSQDPDQAQDENNQIQNSPDLTPVYLSDIMEKNIMVETEDGFALAGIVIGLSMNSNYQYTDSQGVTYTQEISMGEMRERARQYANIIVGRLRSDQNLRSVPILVGVYRKAPEHSVVGGSYILDGISREGNSVSDWTEINEYYVSLPILSSEGADESYLYFENFQNSVREFFPNLNGIVGEALYIDDQLAELNIEVTTQFFRRTEITALTQHITDTASKYLPTGIPIQITINSDAGVQAFVARQASSEHFTSHVFK